MHNIIMKNKNNKNKKPLYLLPVTAITTYNPKHENRKIGISTELL